ncbi:MAG: hypothetical protein NTW64_03765 [Candidatus Omnitrophica bacterium]|nr:hypothetical protein [Candidatus Omnitrophota bacterium]
MPKYHLEFILYIQDASLDILKNSIIEFGEGLEIIELSDEESDEGNSLTSEPEEQIRERKVKKFKISLHTLDPTIIFDTCAQFGKIKSVKINEG